MEYRRQPKNGQRRGDVRAISTLVESSATIAPKFGRGRPGRHFPDCGPQAAELGPSSGHSFARSGPTLTRQCGLGPLSARIGRSRPVARHALCGPMRAKVGGELGQSWANSVRSRLKKDAPFINAFDLAQQDRAAPKRCPIDFDACRCRATLYCVPLHAQSASYSFRCGAPLVPFACRPRAARA